MERQVERAKQWVEDDLPLLVRQAWERLPKDQYGWRSPTQGELAAELGISRSAFRDRLTYRCTFQAHEIDYICRRLGIDIPYYV